MSEDNEIIYCVIDLNEGFGMKTDVETREQVRDEQDYEIAFLDIESLDKNSEIFDYKGKKGEIIVKPQKAFEAASIRVPLSEDAIAEGKVEVKLEKDKKYYIALKAGDSFSYCQVNGEFSYEMANDKLGRNFYIALNLLCCDKEIKGLEEQRNCTINKVGAFTIQDGSALAVSQLSEIKDIFNDDVISTKEKNLLGKPGEEFFDLEFPLPTYDHKTKNAENNTQNSVFDSALVRPHECNTNWNKMLIVDLSTLSTDNFSIDENGFKIDRETLKENKHYKVVNIVHQFGSDRFRITGLNRSKKYLAYYVKEADDNGGKTELVGPIGEKTKLLFYDDGLQGQEVELPVIDGNKQIIDDNLGARYESSEFVGQGVEKAIENEDARGKELIYDVKLLSAPRKIKYDKTNRVLNDKQLDNIVSATIDFTSDKAFEFIEVDQSLFDEKLTYKDPDQKKWKICKSIEGKVKLELDPNKHYILRYKDSSGQYVYVGTKKAFTGRELGFESSDKENLNTVKLRCLRLADFGSQDGIGGGVKTLGQPNITESGDLYDAKGKQGAIEFIATSTVEKNISGVQIKLDDDEGHEGSKSNVVKLAYAKARYGINDSETIIPNIYESDWKFVEKTENNTFNIPFIDPNENYVIRKVLVDESGVEILGGCIGYKIKEDKETTDIVKNLRLTENEMVRNKNDGTLQVNVTLFNLNELRESAIDEDNNIKIEDATVKITGTYTMKTELADEINDKNDGDGNIKRVTEIQDEDGNIKFRVVTEETEFNDDGEGTLIETFETFNDGNKSGETKIESYFKKDEMRRVEIRGEGNDRTEKTVIKKLKDNNAANSPKVIETKLISGPEPAEELDSRASQKTIIEISANGSVTKKVVTEMEDNQNVIFESTEVFKRGELISCDEYKVLKEVKDDNGAPKIQKKTIIFDENGRIVTLSIESSDKQKLFKEIIETFNKEENIVSRKTTELNEIGGKIISEVKFVDGDENKKESVTVTNYNADDEEISKKITVYNVDDSYSVTENGETKNYDKDGNEIKLVPPKHKVSLGEPERSDEYAKLEIIVDNEPQGMYIYVNRNLVIFCDGTEDGNDKKPVKAIDASSGTIEAVDSNEADVQIKISDVPSKIGLPDDLYDKLDEIFKVIPAKTDPEGNPSVTGNDEPQKTSEQINNTNEDDNKSKKTTDQPHQKARGPRSAPVKKVTGVKYRFKKDIPSSDQKSLKDILSDDQKRLKDLLVSVFSALDNENVARALYDMTDNEFLNLLNEINELQNNDEIRRIVSGLEDEFGKKQLEIEAIANRKDTELNENERKQLEYQFKKSFETAFRAYARTKGKWIPAGISIASGAASVGLGGTFLAAQYGLIAITEALLPIFAVAPIVLISALSVAVISALVSLGFALAEHKDRLAIKEIKILDMLEPRVGLQPQENQKQNEKPKLFGNILDEIVNSDTIKNKNNR